ncbi:hypothetical protein [Acidovorax sp.]|uniref:hypothetical protein n=1 Tax=Acidovorax sp. TaxID=1872122 RepID=UPI00391F18B5
MDTYNTKLTVNMVGELLIRAAAAIGRLSPQEQAQLAAATDGMPADLAKALSSCAAASESVRKSLRTHPPAGFGLPLAHHSE